MKARQRNLKKNEDEKKRVDGKKISSFCEHLLFKHDTENIHFKTSLVIGAMVFRVWR